MSTSRRKFLGFLAVAPLAALLGARLPGMMRGESGMVKPYSPKTVERMTYEQAWMSRLAHQARVNNQIQVLTITPNGEYSMIQISAELFEDVPKVAGEIWAHEHANLIKHLRGELRAPGTPR